MTLDTFDDLLDLLDDVTPTATGSYVAQCPSHEDDTPSLSVALDEDGRVGLYCHARCRTAAVVAALGITFPDLFGVKPGTATVATSSGKEPPTVDHVRDLTAYVHTAAGLFPDSPAASVALARFGIDAARAAEPDLLLGFDDGSIECQFLHGAYRRAPRLTVPFHDFTGALTGLQGRSTGGPPDAVRWCGPTNPRGHGWSTLAVFMAHDYDADVIITEGPGDALAAVGAGLNAVAIRGAALGRQDATTDPIIEHLKDRRLLLCGDADPSGRDFNEVLAERFDDAGIHAHVLDLPDGAGDLADWRAQAGADFVDQIKAGLRAAPRVVTPAPAPPPPPAATRLTHRTVAEELLNRHPEFAFNEAMGWLHYNRGAWTPDHPKHRFAAVEETCAHILAVAEAGTDRALLLWARRNNASTSSTESILKQAEALAYRPHDHFDLHDDVLVVGNGTVDLKTGQLGPHDPAHLMTRRVDVHFDPAALAPRWEAFLAEVFVGEPDLPEYLRRLVGYGISGSTAEQCFVILFGKGSNGKSVMTSTLDLLFNAISWTTSYATFEQRQSGSGTSDIAALRGARLVWAMEGEARQRMAEAALKRMTGSDRVTAAAKYKDPFVFRPRFLAWLSSNYLPDFRGVDEGLWRRCKLIEFPRYFEPHERDHYLTAALEKEFPGILTWAVRGAADWYGGGLQDPPVVMKATANYRQGSDELADFVDEHLVLDPEAQTKGLTIVDRYGGWCAAHGERQMSARALYAALSERLDVHKVKTRQGQTLVGVRLAAFGDESVTVATVVTPSSKQLRDKVDKGTSPESSTTATSVTDGSLFDFEAGECPPPPSTRRSSGPPSTRSVTMPTLRPSSRGWSSPDGCWRSMSRPLGWASSPMSGWSRSVTPRTAGCSTPPNMVTSSRRPSWVPGASSHTTLRLICPMWRGCCPPPPLTNSTSSRRSASRPATPTSSPGSSSPATGSAVRSRTR